jgi:hypothetical protein
MNDIPTGCQDDPGLACDVDALGISCPAGTSPDSSTFVCSDPVANGNLDSYCCIVWSGSTCAEDPNVTSSCGDPAFGFSCTGTDSPDQTDPTLICSDPTTDPTTGDSLYCCTDGYTPPSSSGGTIPAGCAADGSVSCTGNAFGYSCAPGDNPEVEDPSLSCSIPETDPATGNDVFCCFDWTAGTSTCTPDDTITSQCPDFDTYGYSCAAANDDPTSLDPALTCSEMTGIQDPVTGLFDFCCTYN